MGKSLDICNELNDQESGQFDATSGLRWLQVLMYIHQ